jgi:uncharacterized protein YjaG (DUF416 family)
MVNRTFNDTELKNRLAKLPCPDMVAFSASCAERLLPTYVRYSKRVQLDAGISGLFHRAMEMIWSQLQGQSGETSEIEELVRVCFANIPDEDVALQAEEPYAADAATAVLFSLNALLSCDPQQAVWSARRVYDVVDNFVAVTDPSSSFDENKIFSHPLVQSELERQEFDLLLLEGPRNGENLEEVFLRMQQKARLDAQILFVETAKQERGE